MRASLFGKIVLTLFFTIAAAHLVDEEAAALRDAALENWKSENGYKTTSLDKRLTTAGLFICENVNWQAPCKWIGFLNNPFPSNTCFTVGQLGFSQVGSFGPDRGLFCTMFVEPNNCNSQSIGNLAMGNIAFPGIANLQTAALSGKPAGYWVKNGLSFTCDPIPPPH